MHHRSRRTTHHLHATRVLLFGVLLVALFLVKVDPQGLSAVRDQSSVLAYATNMSRGDLLAGTNTARSQNGLGGLTLDGQLNNAAQAKAQHMIDNNYWSHVAPDGTQPWYFFEQAGYSYRAAGENLAYGFMTSQATVDAWMNSPSHRANILGDYADVGFGIANGPSYQGNQNTVVVAHYGTRQGASSAPAAPTPSAPVQSAQTPQAPSTPSTPAQSSEPATPVETPTPTETSEQPLPIVEQTTDDIVVETPVVPVASATPKSINVLESLKIGSVPPLAIASIVMTVTAAVGFAVTHRSLVSHAVANGERFVVKHPMFDVAVVGVVSVLILSTTISRIG